MYLNNAFLTTIGLSPHEFCPSKSLVAFDVLKFIPASKKLKINWFDPLFKPNYFCTAVVQCLDLSVLKAVLMTLVSSMCTACDCSFIDILADADV